MDSSKLSDWLQVAGLFGVIASLVFVGLQMKQADTIAESDVYQERAIASRETNLTLSTNPYFLSGMAKLYSGAEKELTAQEAIALEYDFGSRLFIADNYFQQYELGFLSNSFWDRTVTDMKCYLEHPFYREAITRGWIQAYRAEFRVVLLEMIGDAANNPSGCWEFEFQYQIAQ